GDEAGLEQRTEREFEVHHVKIRREVGACAILFLCCGRLLWSLPRCASAGRCWCSSLAAFTGQQEHSAFRPATPSGPCPWPSSSCSGTGVSRRVRSLDSRMPSNP